ncbi:MAG: hypothetical protein FJX65_04835 [Alphaproteobacteria bacterium]|nr:hypothetical protein [Alphaproteobacteria bacterium]
MAARLDEKRLAIALATLLPGDDGWPSASVLNLTSDVTAFLERDAAQLTAVAKILTALPGEFDTAQGPQRDAMLAACERENTAAFQALVTAAYAAYYTHATVLAAIERFTGLSVHPPQPDGYTFSPFPTDRLKQMAARAGRAQR